MKIFNRFYSDFIMPSRLDQYEQLINKALSMNYEVCSIEIFWNKVKQRTYDNGIRYLILRHDIDTDVSTAKEIFKIEQNYKVYSSYYFRLSTLDGQFMNDIAKCGSEASYHYEEIASFAKKNDIKDAREIHKRIDEIKDLFSLNLSSLRDRFGLPMNIVASHGDFVNRILGIPNNFLLKNLNFRKVNDIVLEVYDREMMDLVNVRCSDTGYPDFWKPFSPLNSIEKGSKIVYILTHPRHWKSNIVINIKDDLRRVHEGIRYSFT